METFEHWLQKYINRYFSSIARVLVWIMLLMITGFIMSNYCINLETYDCLFTLATLHVLYLPIAVSNYRILHCEIYTKAFCMCIGEALFLGFFLYGLNQESGLSEILFSASWVALDITVVPMTMNSKIARFMKLQPLILWILNKLYRNQLFIPTRFEPYLAMTFILIGVLYIQSKYFNTIKGIFSSHIKSRNSEAQLKKIIQVLPEAIIMLGNDWEILLTNNLAKYISGTSEPASVKNFLRCLKYYESTRFYSEGIKECNDIFSDILHFSKKENTKNVIFGVVSIEEKLYQWSGSKFNWHDTSYVILSASEVSTLVSMEKLKAENKYKHAMMRAVSHELRTPSIAIMSFTEQIMEEEDRLSSRTKFKLHMARVCSKLLLNLIKNLVDYSQMVAGTFIISKRFFSITGIINECYQMIKTQCEKKKLNVKILIDPRLPYYTYNDSERISQVLLNLLINSVKFTISGRITIEAIYTECKQLLIRVRDTGIGIDQQNMNHLFSMFQQYDGNNLSSQCSGLGLHISSLVVPKLGGEQISVVSTPEQGSEFSFLVDIFEEKPELDEGYELWDESICIERALVQSMPSFDAAPSFSDKKIEVLIVDDNDFNRAVVSEFLEEIGLNYHEACTGKQAVENVIKFNKGDGGYKVVLMDCEMPVMNGWEATQSIIQMWEEGKIDLLPAVIGYTAYAGVAEARKCLEAGMICYLNKPVPKRELIDTIKRYLH